jgi:hypothetical protein
MYEYLRGVTLRFPAGARELSPLQRVQNGSGVHPNFYSAGPWGVGAAGGAAALAPGVKQPLHNANNSHPFSMKIMNKWIYTFNTADPAGRTV